MSISTDGFARRKFIAGMRLWPPARKRASLPCSALAASAAESEGAARYLNRGGFTAHLLLVHQLPMADHRHRRRVLAQRFEDIRLLQNRQVGRLSNGKLVILDVDGAGGARRDHVVERLHVGARRHPQKMRGEEDDLEHV